MTTLRANIADLLDPRFRVIHDDTLLKTETVYDKIFNIKNSNMKQERQSGIAGFGLAVAKGEGQVVTYDDPIQKYDKTFEHTTYSLGFRVSEEALDDDLSGSLAKMPALLSKSMIATIETLTAQMFDRSQNASYTGADGKVLCATDHPHAGGGSQANRPDTNADLSVTVLEAALSAMRKNVNDRGIVMPLMPKFLLIPPDYEWTAIQLLENAEKSGTTNRDINAVKTRGLSYIVNEYLTDTDAFYLLTEKELHQLEFYWRKQVAMRSDTDTDTGDGKFISSMRFSHGWVDYRGIYGSIGI